MSNASAKEPSMDEILSSIRQIIADDDAGITPPAPAPLDDPKPEPEPEASVELEAPAEPEEAPEEALSLSAEQIVEEETVPEEPEDPMAAADLELAEAEVALADDDDFQVPDLVEPDDISFGDDVEAVVEIPEPVAEVPDMVEEAPQPAPEPAMPDPHLSDDIADKLLEPATGEAVKATFSKLSHLALGSQSLTIENMIREMLRPMLKDWLDENLPSVVEKMVEKEIERISRGG